jgi:predicted acetyltransferase
MFHYQPGRRFVGKNIEVVIDQCIAAQPEKGWVPAYNFYVVLSGHAQKIGALNVRIGYTDALVKYGGHIGYAIDEAYRGHHFAGQACQLIKPLLQAHGMDVVWITCNPDNWPSRKTCEYLGCQFIEIIELPEESDMYQEGERQKCRYRWLIYP